MSRNLKKRLNLSTTSVLNMPCIRIVSPADRSNQSKKAEYEGHGETEHCENRQHGLFSDDQIHQHQNGCECSQADLRR